MHEFSIAKQVVDCLKKIIEEEKAIKVFSFEIEIGEFSFTNDEQLKFWLKELLKNNIAAKAKIKIKKVEPIINCTKCGYNGGIKLVDDPAYHFFLPQLRCKKCGATRVTLVKGRECNLRSVKIEKLKDKGKR